MLYWSLQNGRAWRGSQREGKEKGGWRRCLTDYKKLEAAKPQRCDFMWRPGVWWVALLLDQQSITMCESAPPPTAVVVPSWNEAWVMLHPPVKKTLAAIPNNTQWGCLITQLPVLSSNALPAPPHYLPIRGLKNGRRKSRTTVLKLMRGTAQSLGTSQIVWSVQGFNYPQTLQMTFRNSISDTSVS